MVDGVGKNIGFGYAYRAVDTRRAAEFVNEHGQTLRQVLPKNVLAAQDAKHFDVYVPPKNTRAKNAFEKLVDKLKIPFKQI